MNHGSITPMEALRLFGCYRLGARIYDLRKSGMKIRTLKMDDMNRVSGKSTTYAKYIKE